MRTTDSINGSCGLENISRHLVDKNIIRITLPNGDHLDLTEDHSLMVYRKGVGLIEIKPLELLKTDYLICK